MTSRAAMLAAAAVLWTCSIVHAAPEATAPVHTNKARFRIPYHYDPAEMQKLGAREIRLYLSVDQGRQWQLVQSVDPRARKFDFQAPQDGEYWFAVRTLDGQNNLHPQTEAMDAGLKVVVDTAGPTFNVALRQLDGGRIELAWTAQDAHLDLTTLRLEYLQTGGTQWEPVAVVPQASGRTEWAAPQGGVVSVRGSIADLAGNAKTAQAQLQIVPGQPAAPAPPQPDFRQPIANGPGGELAALPNPFPTAAADPALAVPSPAPMPVAGPAPALTSVAENAAARPEIVRRAEPFGPAANAPTAGGAARVVSARQFQIGYTVDEVGPSGVKSVELYITEDGGRKWFKYGNDPDVKSPFPVEVPRDGVYGFTIRVRSGVGLAADPPYPGDRPSTIITVDTTPPTISLAPPEQGQGPTLNRILVRWRLGDDNPADKPVLVSYAGDPTGPWTPIGSWQADSGSFAWTVGPGTPSRLFIRVTARDAAGNLAHADTPQPVLIDLARPSARIVDVEPAGTVGR